MNETIMAGRGPATVGALLGILAGLLASPVAEALLWASDRAIRPFAPFSERRSPAV